MYNRIKQAGEFDQYLIPFNELTDTEIFFEMIDRYQKVILKPMVGNQGGGIVFIEKDRDRYRINEAGVISTRNEEQLLDLLSEKIEDEDYVVHGLLQAKPKPVKFSISGSMCKKMEKENGWSHRSIQGSVVWEPSHRIWEAEVTAPIWMSFCKQNSTTNGMISNGVWSILRSIFPIISILYMTINWTN